MMRSLFIVACSLFSLIGKAQYLETFSLANKGYLPNLANDFSGVNWTLSGWSADNTLPGWPGRDVADYFHTTTAGKLEAIDLDHEVYWESPLLNISAAGSVSMSVDLSWLGFDNDITGNPCTSGPYGTNATLDLIKVMYSINGGAYTNVNNVRGGASCATVAYSFGAGTGKNDAVSVFAGGISGTTLQIRILINANANGELVTIDNVSVPQDGVVLGCIAPVITAPQVTQPTCSTSTGRIIIRATGTETMRYSIDDGATYKNTASFPDLPPGTNYRIKVRYLSTPSCVSTFANNPVVINPPPPPTTWYLDLDNDGYFTATQIACTSPGTGWKSALPSGGGGDCNDNPANGGAAIHPGAVEICNGIDDNCNGLVDDGTIVLVAPTSIAGPVGVCRNDVNQVFSVAAVPGATSYQWTLPFGATGTSTTNSISLNFSSTYVSGNICVRAVNACGRSAYFCREIKYYGAKPVTPGVISGKAIGLCSNQVYSIAPVPNTTNYNWVIPANTTIVSGQGTTQIVLSFGSGFSSGILSVTAANCKGISSARTLALSKTPEVPSLINGPSIEVCGGSTQTYSCPSVAGATVYNWTVPAEAFINSGQGTTSISVTFPETFLSGNVRVSAGTSCGNSGLRSLSVSSKPSFPSAIVGPVSVCPNATGLQYSTTSAAGVNYNWVVPNGATITSGQGTNAITVNWGTVAGMVKVQGRNACGTSSFRTLSVSLQTCITGVVSMAKADAAEVAEALDVKIWPNPARDVLMVTLDNFKPNQKMELALLQADGKVLQAQSLVPAMKGQQVRMDVSRAAGGYYILAVKQSGALINRQVIILRN